MGHILRRLSGASASLRRSDLVSPSACQGTRGSLGHKRGGTVAGDRSHPSLGGVAWRGVAVTYSTSSYGRDVMNSMQESVTTAASNLDESEDLI